MLAGINDHFHITVSLVVQLVDDFTNQVPGESGIYLEADGQKKPVRKADGFFVFTNLSSSVVVLTVKAPLYQEEVHRIEMNSLNPERMIKLRLKPNRSYGLPKGTTCIEGETEPFKQIFAYFPNDRGFYKLMFDAKKKKGTEVPVIGIYNPEKEDLEERYFMLSNEEEKKEELIRIIALTEPENGSYQMEKPLKNSYKKIGSRLYPVATATANAEGLFFLPLKSVRKPDLDCILMDESHGEKRVTLEEGKINHIHYPS